ncbi:MAG: hypothetical protein OXG81_13820 [Acidobacteria bacterium]|nr:hypothetical protein [Acidobacteriota bacterium]
MDDGASAAGDRAFEDWFREVHVREGAKLNARRRQFLPSPEEQP